MKENGWALEELAAGHGTSSRLRRRRRFGTRRRSRKSARPPGGGLWVTGARSVRRRAIIPNDDEFTLANDDKFTHPERGGVDGGGILRFRRCRSFADDCRGG